MTFQEALQAGSEILRQNGIVEYSLDAWYLLEHTTEVSRAAYYARPEAVLEESMRERFFVLLHKRSEGVPLQHLTGVQEFMGLEFEVNEHVLIPRQDTELLAEAALELVRPDMRILDMYTGSGCILISVWTLARQKQLTGLCGVGADISKAALCVAARNAKKHHADVDLIESDLFESVTGTFDLIISNPPYIRTAEIPKLQREVRIHDPYLALDGREDGLCFYRKIIRESTRYLAPGGHLMFEIGYDQAEEVSAMMAEAGYCQINVKKDLAGLDRVVQGYMTDKNNVQIERTEKHV